MAPNVTDPTEGLRKTRFESKMARCRYLLEGGRRSANRVDRLKWRISGRVVSIV